MTGFLARLAARTGGLDGSSVDVVRARHPFAFEPDRSDLTEQLTAPIADGSWRPDAPQPPPRQRPAPVGRGAPPDPEAGATERPDAEDTIVPDGPARVRLDQAPHPVSSASRPVIAEGTSEPPRPPALAALPAANPAAEPFAAVTRDAALLVAPRDHDALDLDLDKAENTLLRPSRVTPEPAVARARSDLVEPVAEEAGNAEPRRVERGRRQPLARPAAASDNSVPTVVHVSIGRVEVRATPETSHAASPSDRPPDAAVTTLDAYLRQRARGQR